MGQTSRCALCGKLIDRDSAYVAISRGARKFFCSKEEYQGGEAYVKNRMKFENDIENTIKSILGLGVFDAITYTTEYNKWLSMASPEDLYGFLIENKEPFRIQIANKGISNATSRLRYLSKMITNNIVKYISSSNSRQANFSTPKINLDYAEYAPRLEPRKTIRRSLAEIEEGL